LEKLTAHLQTQTGSTALTSVPREFMHHLIVRTKPAYLRMIQVCRTRKEFAGSAGEYWRISAMMAGFTGMGVSVSHSDVSAPGELIVHFALQDYALRQVGGASLYGAPDWLVTGFAYYGAYAATGKNLVHRIAYRPNELQLGENWNLELKRIAAAGHLKPWDNLFLLSLADWTSREHVAAYSIVSFLFQKDPKKFLQLVIEFRQKGRRSTEAVEAAYGEKIADLQQQWLRWAAQQK